MRKCANISPYVRRPLVKYDFSTAPFWISWYMREIFFSFLSEWTASYIHTHTELHSQPKVLPKNLQLSSVYIHREPNTDYSRAVRGRLSFVLFSTTCKSMHTLWYGPPVQVQTSTNCLNWRRIFPWSHAGQIFSATEKNNNKALIVLHTFHIFKVNPNPS